MLLSLHPSNKTQCKPTTISFQNPNSPWSLPIRYNRHYAQWNTTEPPSYPKSNSQDQLTKSTHIPITIWPPSSPSLLPPISPLLPHFSFLFSLLFLLSLVWEQQWFGIRRNSDLLFLGWLMGWMGLGCVIFRQESNSFLYCNVQPLFMPKFYFHFDRFD